MSNVKTLLDKYSDKVKALKAFQGENKSVFDQHQTLLFAVIDAENELKDEVASTKEVAKNDFHEVKRTPQTQTFADIEVIDQLINNGVIPASRRSEIVKVQDRPDYIGIREINQEA